MLENVLSEEKVLRLCGMSLIRVPYLYDYLSKIWKIWIPASMFAPTDCPDIHLTPVEIRFPSQNYVNCLWWHWLQMRLLFACSAALLWWQTEVLFTDLVWPALPGWWECQGWPEGNNAEHVASFAQQNPRGWCPSSTTEPGPKTIPTPGPRCLCTPPSGQPGGITTLNNNTDIT